MKIIRAVYYRIFFSSFKKLFMFFIKKISIDTKTVFLGTPYGGWSFIETDNLFNNVIISAGAGEDISFDIEFINKYNSKVIFIDPTPRALSHLQQTVSNLGVKKTKSYDLEGGKQEIYSYDLENIKKDKIVIIDKALTNKSNEKIKFYKPKEKEFVSHSISNWENNYSEDTDFIEVETISISEIVKKYNLSNVPLLKLDIEGAENIVIPDILDKKIFPEQILVEFDEIHGPYFKAYKSAFFVFFKLLINGYKLITTPMFPDFLFVKKNIITK